MFLIGLLADRSLIRLDQFKITKDPMRYPYLAFVLCLISVLYYMSALNYAHRVYPYIPAFKGGGDYSEVALATIYFDKDAADILPTDIFTTTNIPASVPNASSTNRQVPVVTHPLIILDGTTESVYVALTNSGGGPKEWRKRGGGKPLIYEFRRSLIASIVLLNDTNIIGSLQNNPTAPAVPAPVSNTTAVPAPVGNKVSP
jgi:hypothetical protein